jgi:hypothetical protein
MITLVEANNSDTKLKITMRSIGRKTLFEIHMVILNDRNPLGATLEGAALMSVKNCIVMSHDIPMICNTKMILGGSLKDTETRTIIMEETDGSDMKPKMLTI